MDLLIYGALAAGKEIADIAERVNARTPRWGRICFIDDFLPEKTCYGREVLRLDEAAAVRDRAQVVMAVGEPATRAKLTQKLAAHGLSMTTLVDPGAIVSSTAVLEAGCVVFPGAHISSDVRLGFCCTVQFNSVVGHDVRVGKHSVISSGVMVGGVVQIGDESFVGMCASVKEKTTIGSRSIVGMGAVLFHDLGDDLIALGNPARPVRRNEDRRVFAAKRPPDGT